MRTMCLVIVALASCRPTPPVTPVAIVDPVANPSDPLRFMPTNAEVIFNVDLVQLRTSPLWTATAARVRVYAAAILDPIQRVCGWDPLATANVLTVGVHEIATPSPEAVVVVRGIDRAKLLACAQQAASSGVTITVGADSASVPGVLAAVFVEPTLAVIEVGPRATDETVRGVIAAGAPLRISPPEVLTSGAAWLVATGNANILAAADVAGKPRMITGSLRVLGDLSLAARVQFTAPEAAEQFAQRARAQLAESTWLVQRSSVTVRNNAALIEMVATFPEAARMIEASAPLP